MDYDACNVTAYDDFFEGAPFYRHCVLYTLLETLLSGPLEGKRVLDLPCGTGHLALALTARGAYVTAADVSQAMLEQCKEHVQDFPQVRCVQHDALETGLIPPGAFDYACVLHLLCFANTYPKMVRMSRTILMNLKKGGRAFFYTCTAAPQVGSRRYSELTHSKVLRYQPVCEDGPVAVEWEILHGPEPFTLSSYAWAQSAQLRALQEAGFQQVRVHPLGLNPAYSGEMPLDRFSEETGMALVEAIS